MIPAPNAPAGQFPADVLYGVAGWSYADWEGIVYPRGADGQTKLLAVASACDLLEVNTSFYATPRPAVVEAWARRLTQAGLHNRMVVKINRVFTHEEQYTADDVRALRDALAPLDADPVVDRHGVEHPRLLGLLMQFPFFFQLTPENSQRIERLAEDFPDWTKIIELRHPSWARPAALDWLAQHDLNLANLDLPMGGSAGSTRDVAQPPSAVNVAQPPSAVGAHPYAFPPKIVATGPVGYLRLHGRNNKAWFDRKAAVDQKYNYLYTPEELNDLAGRIRELAGRTRTVAVVGNNHYRGKALATVLNLANLVDGRKASVPRPMIEEYPHLAPFAEAAAAPAVPVSPPPKSAPPKAKPASRPPPPTDDPNQLKLF